MGSAERYRSMKITPILNAASEAFEVPAREIRSISRKDYIVEARHAVMFLARAAGADWSQISDFFNMNHKAPVYGAARAARLIETSPDFRAAITETRAKLEAAQ